MSTQKKYAKCPKCLPDSPNACFHAENDWSGEDRKPVWKCQNCWYTMPRRINRTKSEDTTPSQNALIKRLTDAGYSITKMSMVGRDVWIEAVRKSDNWLDETNVYGTIGPRGAYKLHSTRPLLKTQEVTDETGLKVYCLYE